MSTRFTIQLGELRLAKYDLGNKANLLDQISLKDISNKGLLIENLHFLRMPVPESCVILDEFFHHATAQGLARMEGDQVVIDDARAFMDAIELPPISGKVAVRSAFTAEDKSDASYTGRFDSVLHVPIESFGVSPSRVRDPKPLAEAIAKVWSSGLKGGVGGRMDILVMRMIDAKYSGVAFTELDYEDDLVNYTEGLADELLAGHKEGASLEIPKLQSLEFPSESYNNLSFAPRLQMILRSIRIALGKGNWDVEWADDGVKTWIIQVRPITAPTVRNEVFTYAPLKEGLPELPSRFMASLIESCGSDVFDLYREIDPSLPAGRKYVEVLYGRPMVNLSLMMDLARHWGLATSMVTWFLNERAPNEAGANRIRLMRSRGARLGTRLRALRAPGRSKAVAREIQALTQHPGDSVGEVIDTARKAYVLLTRQMLLLRDAMGRRYSGAGRSLGTQMYSDLAPLRQIAQDNRDLLEALSKGVVPRDGEFRRRWENWLQKHGHRAVYETDLSRPRFRDNQAEILQMIAQPGAATPIVRRSPFAAIAGKSGPAKAAQAREELRFDAMVAFEKIRRRLLEVALPKGVSAEMLFSLTVDEARQLDGNWRPSAEFIAKRREEIAALQAIRVPDVMRRNDALEAGGASVSLHGVGLNRGQASGKALILRDPISKLPDGYSPTETILIASAVDAGWVPTFGLVGGVVVESGGNLSHGSIILRELGIPSVTNVRGATHDIKPGQRVKVVASEGRVDLLSH